MKFPAERVVGSCGFLLISIYWSYSKKEVTEEKPTLKSNLVTFSEIRVGIRCGFSCFFHSALLQRLCLMLNLF